MLLQKDAVIFVLGCCTDAVQGNLLFSKRQGQAGHSTTMETGTMMLYRIVMCEQKGGGTMLDSLFLGHLLSSQMK